MEQQCDVVHLQNEVLYEVVGVRTLCEWVGESKFYSIFWMVT